MRTTRAVLLTLLAAALAALAAGTTAAGAAGLAGGTASAGAAEPGYTQLSNETTLSRWAYTNLTYKVRRSPSNRSRAIAKLHFNTEDGYPEIYLALRQYTAASGTEWVQVRIPGRPNGRTGWVLREGLGEWHVTRKQLVVNRRSLRITLFNNGRRVFQAPVGVGKASTPTPPGRFWIRERLPGLGTAYGPVAFGTAAYSDGLSDWPGGGVIGIHGTNEPALVPGRPSHGCIRLHNSDILRLARLMGPGTPLQII